MGNRDALLPHVKAASVSLGGCMGSCIISPGIAQASQFTFHL
jgi:hypothetical protein